MEWDESRGWVSRAFGRWRAVDRDQRAFLGFGLHLAGGTYDRLWEEEARGPGGETVGSELFDTLWPREWEWMHAAAVFRETVTNFEVYVEQARAEIAGGALESEARWTDLVAAFRRLGVAIEPEAIESARELRRVLTHQDGELCTEAQLARFGGDPAPDEGPALAAMSEDLVLGAMDAIADVVRAIDPRVWELAGRRGPGASVGVEDIDPERRGQDPGEADDV
jgi:hypothetical protein